jgi:exodeoxyribonuclease VII small subunit
MVNFPIDKDAFMSKVSNLKEFEKSLEKLEQIVSDLEQGDLSLEKSLDHFEEGVKIYQSCQKTLEHVEKRVKVLTDKLEEESFDEED